MTAGALRFMDTEDGPFLTMIGEPFPPLINLSRLLSATDRIERDEETEEDLLLVLAPVLRLGVLIVLADGGRRGHLTSCSLQRDLLIPRAS